MSSIKRKAVTDERPSKKAKSASSDDSAKQRRNSGKVPGSTKTTGSHVDQKKSVTASVLQQEERAFPRGGGSVLTPLEHRQIKAQAERDVLHEQENGQVSHEGEELLDEHSQINKKKGRKAAIAKSERIPKVEGSGVKIFGLSYKNLAVGSLVLGRVTAISRRDVALALPNNLTGYAPITNISEGLNGRIEKLLANEEDQLDESEDDEEDVDLKRLFHIGQWLRAFVVSTNATNSDAEGKSKRHIELSLDPVHTNVGLTSDNAAINSMVQASVRSVEDHGIIMNLGLSDEGVSGFISKKELGLTFNLDNIQEGQVFLCLVTGQGSNGKVLKLSPDAARFTISSPSNQKVPILYEAPSVDTFLPGAAVSALVIDAGPGGVVGKLMGMQDVVADVLHSGPGGEDEELSKTYKIGSKVKARIIWSLPADDGSRRVGISLLEHLLALTPAPSRLPPVATQKQKTQAADLDQKLPTSSFVEDAKVVRVLSERGLFLELPSAKGSPIAASAHISQISDKRIDSLSSTTGPYKLDSFHRVRILSYNPIDNLYYVSLKPSTLAQPFMRIEDLAVGELVEGTVDKLILGGPRGIVGVLVRLSESVTSLVPELHLSDTQLTHPERKFREGISVKARVLSVDLERRQSRLTLKKSLVDIEDEQSIWKNYANLQPGMETKGTVTRLLSSGAAVQFFGRVRAWLPVAEMSETYVQSPGQHFRLGQTVSVHILSLDPDAGEMKVSCKDHNAFGPDRQAAWNSMSGGEIVQGQVAEKNLESVVVDLTNGLRGTVRIGHLVDGSASKAESALKRLRVGQKLENLLVLEKLERSQTVSLSDKPGMIEDAKDGVLIKSFQDAICGKKVHGFVRNVTSSGAFVGFANGIVALLPKSQILPEFLDQPNFGLRTDQSIATWVIFADPAKERISLSMREQKETQSKTGGVDKPSAAVPVDLEEPVDTSINSLADISLGRIVKVRVASVKATQINVRLAKNVQGRIDVSEAFDTWEEIKNKKAPLQKFQQNETIEVKVLGIHDARSHRFLPISHRQGKVPVFELSAKKSRIVDGQQDLLTLGSVLPGSSQLAFVNNYGENCVWVNLSPNVRGRIALMDLSDDVGALQNVERHFRIGSSLRVHVKHVDEASNRLDLTAKSENQVNPTNLEDFSPGMLLAARVVTTTERSVVVQLSDNLIAHVELVELSDDYDQANLTQYAKNDIVRACVIEMDMPNKKVYLSLRPSKVLSSSLPVKDPQVTAVTQLEPGEIVRGFVKQVSDKGVFVSLGARVDAFVRIADLSDQYVKNWKNIFSVDQLVKGRVIGPDKTGRNVQISLKSSQVDKDYKPPMTINDLETGQIVTGKVRKVEDFGAFIDIDNTQPRVSGLCHRSEVAAKKVVDVRTLYTVGDVVKVKILKIDLETRKISLGLKASYFKDEASEVEDNEDVDYPMNDGAEDSDGDDDGGVDVDDFQSFDSEPDDEPHQEAMDVDDQVPAKSLSGLKAGGFDWTGDTLDADEYMVGSEAEGEMESQKKRKRTKPEITVDKTGELDKYGPRSNSDFERQLLGQPNKAELWIQYMAFQMEFSEVQKAREIAERALRTINIRETEEKGDVWTAWLNLEVTYGDDDRVEDVFKQACQHQDPLEMHERLASTYINVGKHDRADAIFERMVGNKTFRASPAVWYNYATFLMDTLKSSAKARALLPRALQSISKNEHQHRSLTAKFAALEFHSSQGDVERGRTIFEGLVTEWPNWKSGWDMFVDLERGRASSATSAESKDQARDNVRALFQRMTSQKMNKRRALFLFKKWMDFEKAEGDSKQLDRVRVLAEEYVKNYQAKDDSMND